MSYGEIQKVMCASGDELKEKTGEEGTSSVYQKLVFLDKIYGKLLFIFILTFLYVFLQ